MRWLEMKPWPREASTDGRAARRPVPPERRADVSLQLGLRRPAEPVRGLAEVARGDQHDVARHRGRSLRGACFRGRAPQPLPGRPCSSANRTNAASPSAATTSSVSDADRAPARRRSFGAMHDRDVLRRSGRPSERHAVLGGHAAHQLVEQRELCAGARRRRHEADGRDRRQPA
jgi:hypothetical protein